MAGKTHQWAASVAASVLAFASLAQAADQTPQQVFDSCIKDADKARDDALRLCTGKTGDLLRNCQQRAQNTRIAADARCTARMQQAVNASGARDREREAREAARSGRPN